MEMTVMRNATLTVLREVQRFGLVSQEKEKEIAARWTQRMLLKGHIEEPVNICQAAISKGRSGQMASHSTKASDRR
jgi:hypothetical protein